MSQALDTMQAQLARTQLALDPPDVLVRVAHDSCAFYEFWRAKEMIEVGRAAAEHALEALARQNGNGDRPAQREQSAQGDGSGSSDERRVGHERVSTGSCRWSPYQ